MVTTRTSSAASARLIPILFFLVPVLVPGALVMNRAAAEETASQPEPCRAEAYRQFDFWLGEWESFSADGTRQGENRLSPIMGGCAIQENWTGRDGQYRGTSFNFYDEATDTWHQTWIDNQGGHLFLSGGLVERSMRLTGPGKNQAGEDITHRITWTPLDDGRVRQHWQTSTDGENWRDAFDGFYQPRRETAE